MARLPKSGRSFAAVADASVVQMPLDQFTAYCLKRYGHMTVEDRALPDSRDGLKPVHRRILYSMYKMGLHYKTGPKKSARIVGDTMGKYHPHGDGSIYGALVTMANTPTRLVDGHGNWGWWHPDMNAAAMRYTEARLTEFADKCLLDPYYMRVVPMVKNFDGTEEEPLFLPALLPVALLTGSYGIAMGTTTNIPSYEPRGVAALIKIALAGKRITPADCLRLLQYRWSYGGKSTAGREELLAFYRDGRGQSLGEACEYAVDRDARTVTVTAPLVPGWNYTTFFDKVSEMEAVTGVNNTSSAATGISIQVSLKRNLIGAELDKAIADVEARLHTSDSPVINVTRRKLVQVGGLVETAADFQETNIPDMLMDWTRWRVSLEIRALKYELDEITKKIAEQLLIRKAIDHLEIIFKVLRSKTQDPDAALMAAMKITRPEAEYVLNLATRRLSNLSAAKVAERVKELTGEKNRVTALLKNPAGSVLAGLDEVVARSERSIKVIGAAPKRRG